MIAIEAFESALSDKIEPTIIETSKEILLVERTSLESNRVTQLRNKLKYYNLLRDKFLEYVDPNHEYEEADALIFLQLVGASPTYAQSPDMVQEPIVYSTPKSTFILFIDGVETDDWSLPLGIHEYKVRYNGKQEKLAVTINGHTYTSASDTLEFAYSRPTGVEMQILAEAYNDKNEIIQSYNPDLPLDGKVGIGSMEIEEDFIVS